MDKRSYFFLIFSNLVLSLVPVPPGTHFNGFIVLSIFFLSVKRPAENEVMVNQDRLPMTDLEGFLDDHQLNLGRFYRLLLFFFAVEFLVSKFQTSFGLNNQDLTYWIILERPLNLLFLSILLLKLFARRYFVFNLANVLTVVVFFNYFYFSLIEFILEFFLQLEYYRFFLSFSDTKEMFQTYLDAIKSPELAKDKIYQESARRVFDFLIQKINAMTNLLNLFYLVCLIKIFRRRIWSVDDRSFQFKWFQLPDKVIWPFLIGWAILLIQPKTVFSSLGEQVAVFFRHASFTLVLMIGGLYFIQGIGVVAFLIKKLFYRFKLKALSLFGLILILFLVTLLQNGLFLMMLVFILSMGIMDRWINYRKI